MKKGLNLIFCLMVGTFFRCDQAGAVFLDNGNCGPIVSGTGSNEDPYVYDSNCKWSLDSHGKLTITGSGKMAQYTYTWNTPWNNVIRQIKEVTVAKDLTSLSGFTDAVNLEKITFEEGSQVSSMWYENFQNTPKLKSIKLPEKMMIISQGQTFLGSGIESIDLPSTLQGMSYSTFAGARNLKSIVIPDGITGLGHDLFNGCTSLSDIFIPDSVKTIGADAFKNVNASVLNTNSENLKRYLDTGGQFDSNSIPVINCSGTVSCQHVLENWLADKYGENKTNWPSWYDKLLFNNKRYVQNADGSYSVYELGKFIGYKNKRIYTVDEAMMVVSGKNTFKLKYR